MGGSTTSSTTTTARDIYSKGGGRMKMDDLISYQTQNDLYLISIWLEDTVKQINRYKEVPEELRELRILLLQTKHDIEERIDKYKKITELSELYKRRYL
jgi:hypothetical protein